MRDMAVYNNNIIAKHLNSHCKIENACQKSTIHVEFVEWLLFEQFDQE